MLSTVPNFLVLGRFQTHTLAKPDLVLGLMLLNVEVQTIENVLDRLSVVVSAVHLFIKP